MNKNLSCDEILTEFKKHSSHTCKKNGDCIQFLQLYLDNMACKNKDAEFLKGVSDCIPCQEYFKINDCIKTNLKSKLESLPVPEEFFRKVQQNISENYYLNKPE